MGCSVLSMVGITYIHHQHPHFHHNHHDLTTGKVSNEVHEPVAWKELSDPHVVGDPLDKVGEGGNQLMTMIMTIILTIMVMVMVMVMMMITLIGLCM